MKTAVPMLGRAWKTMAPVVAAWAEGVGKTAARLPQEAIFF